MSFWSWCDSIRSATVWAAAGRACPYFLQNRIRNVVVMENEYARILLELGMPGLLMWVAVHRVDLHPREIRKQRHVLFRPPAGLRGGGVYIRDRPDRDRALHIRSLDARSS